MAAGGFFLSLPEAADEAAGVEATAAVEVGAVAEAAGAVVEAEALADSVAAPAEAVALPEAGNSG